MFRSRSLSRREALKLGALGSAGLLLPLERFAGAAGGRGADRIRSSGLPAPFTVPFVRPARAVARAHGRHDRLLQPDRSSRRWSRSCRAADADLGLQRHHPGPDDHGAAGPARSSSGRSTRCPRCIRRSATRRRRRRTCTARRRCRSTTATPATSRSPGQYKDYHYPNFQRRARSGTTTTASTSRRENAYMGLAAQYHHPRRRSSRPRPCRRARYDVPLIIRDAMFATDGSLIFDDNSELGTVRRRHPGQRQPWPVMQVERRKYRFRILNASSRARTAWPLDTGEPFT